MGIECQIMNLPEILKLYRSGKEHNRNLQISRHRTLSPKEPPQVKFLRGCGVLKMHCAIQEDR